MPTTNDKLLAAYADPNLTEGERECLEWQYQGPLNFDEHSFKGCLWEAMARADMTNMARLRAGFPTQVAALEAYRNGDLKRKLASLGHGGVL